MITEADRAWCAGIVDAMGSIGSRRMATGSNLVMVSLSTPNVLIAQTMARLTGVTVVMVVRNYNRKGCAEHCTEQHDHVTSVTARWQLVGIRARVFLAAVEPFVRLKSDEVAEALAVASDAPFKAATVRKMLNLGWPSLEEVPA